MTLTELRDRLTKIIEENDYRFPAEKRNEQPVFAHYKVSKRVHAYVPVQFAESCLTGFVNDQQGFVLRLDDDNKIVYGKHEC